MVIDSFLIDSFLMMHSNEAVPYLLISRCPFWSTGAAALAVLAAKDGVSSPQGLLDFVASMDVEEWLNLSSEMKKVRVYKTQTILLG